MKRAYITEAELNYIVWFAREHKNYDFHCETVGFNGETLVCIFNREGDDDKMVVELDVER